MNNTLPDTTFPSGRTCCHVTTGGGLPLTAQVMDNWEPSVKSSDVGVIVATTGSVGSVYNFSNEYSKLNKDNNNSQCKGQ